MVSIWEQCHAYGSSGSCLCDPSILFGTIMAIPQPPQFILIYPTVPRKDFPMSNLSPSGCNFKSIISPHAGHGEKIVFILETAVKIPVKYLTGF